jgi:hypothetical protein
MGFTVRGPNCWICDEPALRADGSSLEPFELSAALLAVAHVRCLPLADLARRGVYQTADPARLGPNRLPVLHIRTSGNGLLCKNELEPPTGPKRRLGDICDFGGVLHFVDREDACAVCARELADQVRHKSPKTAAIRRAAIAAESARVVRSEGSSTP